MNRLIQLSPPMNNITMVRQAHHDINFVTLSLSKGINNGIAPRTGRSGRNDKIERGDGASLTGRVMYNTARNRKV